MRVTPFGWTCSTGSHWPTTSVYHFTVDFSIFAKKGPRLWNHDVVPSNQRLYFFFRVKCTSLTVSILTICGINLARPIAKLLEFILCSLLCPLCQTTPILLWFSIETMYFGCLRTWTSVVESTRSHLTSLTSVRCMLRGDSPLIYVTDSMHFSQEYHRMGNKKFSSMTFTDKKIMHA